MNLISKIKAPEKLIAEIKLPSSKSLANRALIVNYLCGNAIKIHNLSRADDTILMQQLLNSTEKELHVKNAGTVMRFLTACFAATKKVVILVGEKRMEERPIGTLVNALLELGADISYLKNKNYPPIFIKGKQLSGKKIIVSANESSQFISALLLISPIVKNGLTIEIQGNTVSESYIEMTLKLMEYFDIKVEIEKNKITVAEQKYVPKNFTVEADWSSAAYWFAICALKPGSEIFLPNLFLESWQGDKKIDEFAGKYFGITVKYNSNGYFLVNNGKFKDSIIEDVTSIPDLVPTLVVICCALKIKFEFIGTSHLQFKESKRAEALKNELKKLGYKINVYQNSINYSPAENINSQLINEVIMHTYSDHRLAMCWAILAIKHPGICVENYEVVKKSYPTFWNDLKNAGFNFRIH